MSEEKGLCRFGPTPPSGLWNRLYFSDRHEGSNTHASAPFPFARRNINTWKNFHTFSYFMHFSPPYFTLTLAWLSGFDYLGWGSDAVEWQRHQRVDGERCCEKVAEGRGDLIDFKGLKLIPFGLFLCTVVIGFDFNMVKISPLAGKLCKHWEDWWSWKRMNQTVTCNAIGVTCSRCISSTVSLMSHSLSARCFGFMQPFCFGRLSLLPPSLIQHQQEVVSALKIHWWTRSVSS